jgi:hypothetical protein
MAMVLLMGRRLPAQTMSGKAAGSAVAFYEMQSVLLCYCLGSRRCNMHDTTAQCQCTYKDLSRLGCQGGLRSLLQAHMQALRHLLS